MSLNVLRCKGTFVSRLFIAAVLVVLLGGCRHSMQSNPQANDALLALKKLQAKTETGIAYNEYLSALGDANFAVKSFLDSEDAKSQPDLSSSLQEAIKWYRAASEVWSESTGEYATSYEPCVKGMVTLPLCDSYPELVTPVFKDSSATEPGIRYQLAMQESWEFAKFAVENANLATKGQPIRDSKNFQAAFISGLRQHYPAKP